ncbi:MAG: YkgJ family cysteine cluster protein [Nitrosomonadales bacterium]|nr:YkgJ family cysteine cluster protein [Nitrosomonadales bacterium]
MEKTHGEVFAGDEESELTRDSRFAYQCNRCTRCCRQYRIPVGPFDLLQLAEALGVSTTDVIRDHLTDGYYLQRLEDGSCKFLDVSGCTVHPGRPMVCRIYPLGRNVTHGHEWFTILPLVPDSTGERGKTGTVAGYLENQGAVLSIEGLRIYTALYQQLSQLLKQEHNTPCDISENWLAESGVQGFTLAGMLDPDKAIASYCKRHRLSRPNGVLEKAECHARALEEWMLNRLEELK